MNIVAISGSLRKDSLNTALLRGLQELAPEGMTISITEIRGLPMYDEDMEANFPKEAQDLKDAIESADGLVIATPEYNRSVSGALKNALDWASRPYGKSSFTGKPVITAGVTPGRLGTAIAQVHLKEILMHLGARLVLRPELYIGESGKVFDDNGVIVNQEVRDLLTKALEALAAEASR